MLAIKEHRGEKQKLTLGIDKEVIERAKAAGINISAMTEELLKSVTYEPKGKSTDDVVKAYEELFDSMDLLVRKYELWVEVGFASIGDPNYDDDLETFKIYLRLDPQGYPFLWRTHPDDDGDGPTSVAEDLPFLYKPKTILENLISALLGRVEENKQKIRELELAKRFVKVLLSDIERIEG
jgi:hypothetical protein